LTLHFIFNKFNIFIIILEAKKHGKKRKRDSDDDDSSDEEDELMDDIVKLTSSGKIEMELLNDKVSANMTTKNNFKNSNFLFNI
jgi:hypothetical protein